jgi:ADP-ribosyl-[dinitrogen reductase] hydrolase
MRALPIGWVLPNDQAERRRQVTIAISRATHADPAALVAACVVATCASLALENASQSMLLEAATEEAREAAQEATTDARLAEMLTQVSAGTGNHPPTASAWTRTTRWPRRCGARPGPRPCAAGW